MSINFKNNETLDREDIDATIRAAAQLYFSRKRARWIYTSGAVLVERLYKEYDDGNRDINPQYVLNEIEKLEDGHNAID